MSSRLHTAAFSLVELLVVITAIAVLVTVAIPSIANITSSAQRSSEKRNAQNMASVFAAARGAGFTNSVADAAEVASFLTNGISVTNGGLVMSFRVDGLATEQVTRAGAFLSVSNNNVVYNPGTD